MDEEMSNETIVTGKICDKCNEIYDPDVECCPQCGNKELSDLVTTPMLEEIRRKKKRKQDRLILIILFITMFGLFTYMIIRMYKEGAF